PKLRDKIVFLLSGGVDSSMLVDIANEIAKEKDPKAKLKTLTVGMEDSPDLKWANEVAKKLETDHTCITYTAEDAIRLLPEVIRVLETSDVTTARASIPFHIACQTAKNQLKCTILISGEVPDEMGGYRLFLNIENKQEFLNKIISLLKELYLFDCLRVNKCCGAFGLESRLPYSDRDYIEFYTSLPLELIMPHKFPDGVKMEKPFIRFAFDKHSKLPREVLYRSKVTMSDGTASKRKSLKKCIESFIDRQVVSDMEFARSRHFYRSNPPPSKEAYHYRQIFENIYGPQNSHCLPHYWNNM